MKKEVIREHGGKDVHKPVQPISRKPASKFGKFLASATIVSSLLLGSGTKAEDKDNKKLAMSNVAAQAEKKQGLDAYISKMPTVPLAQMQKLDKESKKYRIPQLGGESEMGFSAFAAVNLEGGGRLFYVLVICPKSNITCTEDLARKKIIPSKTFFVFAQDVPGFKNESEYGKPLVAIDLSSADKIHEKLKGKEATHSRIIIEFEKDPENGKIKSITAYAALLNSPTEAITANTVIPGITYFISTPDKLGSGNALVSMR